jgi:hypothetical protein
LPQGFTPPELKGMASQLQPSWVSEGSLERLEQLGLGDAVLDRIVEMLLDGKIAVPTVPPRSGLVAAALQLMRPTTPQSVPELAREVREAYRQHLRFMRLRRKAWLSRLDELAQAQLPNSPAPLVGVLREFGDWQWMLIDSLGLPLEGTMAGVLEDAFPHWQVEQVDYGSTPSHSCTNAFYEGLIGAGFKKRFFKINQLDQLIHASDPNLVDLEKRVRAELEVQGRKLASQLNPQQPLLVFADHGFRLSSDGRSFTHGGSSTLERIVPLFRMKPR